MVKCQISPLIKKEFHSGRLLTECWQNIAGHMHVLKYDMPQGRIMQIDSI